MKLVGAETVADKKGTRRRRTGNIQSRPYFADRTPAADLWAPSRAAEKVKQLKSQRGWAVKESSIHGVFLFCRTESFRGRRVGPLDGSPGVDNYDPFDLTNEKKEQHRILLCCRAGSVRLHPVGSVDDSGGGYTAGRVVAE
jgi:hypothetical protein